MTKSVNKGKGGRPYPPGRIKIADALRSLLETKDFSAITTAEIAKHAGVTEALIYKYFKDKRDLLHQVLAEYIERYHYLGYKPLPGAQLRYFAYAGERLVGLLGYGAAAWKTGWASRVLMTASTSFSRIGAARSSSRCGSRWTVRGC